MFIITPSLLSEAIKPFIVSVDLIKIVLVDSLPVDPRKQVISTKVPTALEEIPKPSKSQRRVLPSTYSLLATGIVVVTVTVVVVVLTEVVVPSTVFVTSIVLIDTLE